MSDEKLIRAAALINAAVARASVRIAGMQSANMNQLVQQKKPVYKESDFLNVITEESLGYNDVMSMLYDH